MKKRTVLIGLVLIAAAGGGLYYYKNYYNQEKSVSAESAEGSAYRNQALYPLTPADLQHRQGAFLRQVRPDP